MSSNSVSSPRKFLSKKPSLSILSGSNINKLNNMGNNLSGKPIKERVVSKSTGLIKLSLDRKYLPNSSITQKENPRAERKGLPIYIPVRKSSENLNILNSKKAKASQIERNTQHELTDEQSKSLLFRLASKQRTVLDLKEKLQITEKELQDLELQYRMCFDTHVNSGIDIQNDNNPMKKPSMIRLKANLEKKASKFNFIVNDGDTVVDNSKQNIIDGLNKISENMSKNELFIKGKTILNNMNRENEKWINQKRKELVKRLQGSSLLNQKGILDTVRDRIVYKKPKTKISQIFEAVIEGANKQRKEDTSDFGEDGLDEIPAYLDYDMPTELKRAEERSFRKKIKGTIMYNEESAKFKRTPRLPRRHYLCEFPSDSENEEEDYGGEVIRYV